MEKNLLSSWRKLDRRKG